MRDQNLPAGHKRDRDNESSSEPRLLCRLAQGSITLANLFQEMRSPCACTTPSVQQTRSCQSRLCCSNASDAGNIGSRAYGECHARFRIVENALHIDYRAFCEREL